MKTIRQYILRKIPSQIFNFFCYGIFLLEVFQVSTGMEGKLNLCSGYSFKFRLKEGLVKKIKFQDSINIMQVFNIGTSRHVVLNLQEPISGRISTAFLVECNNLTDTIL